MGNLPEPLAVVAVLLAVIALALIRLIARKRPKLKILGGVAGLLLLYILLRLVERYLPAGFRDLAGPYVHSLKLLVLSLAVIRLGVWCFFDIVIPHRRKVAVADIVKDLSVIGLSLIALFVILRITLNINLASLITTSAVLTIVIGLALQDTLANMFAGLALEMQKPFEIGEWISFDGFTGRVEEVTWRTTAITTIGRDRVTIPNSLIAKSPVTNYSRPTPLHERTVHFHADLSVPPNRVKEAALESLKDDPEVCWEIPPEIRVRDYTELGIHYDIRFFITDFPRHKYIEDHVLTRVWYHLRRAGAPIPLPAQDVRLRTVTRRTEDEERTDLRRKIIGTLAGVEFLSPLSETEREVLSSRITIFTAHRQEVVIRQGDPGDSCFIIHSGKAEVSVATPQGETDIGGLGPGQVFGEMSLMTGDERSATVRALTDMELIVVNKENFARILSANPDIAAKISSILAKRQMELERKLRDSEEAIRKEDLESHTSRLIAKIRDFFGL